jgi:hypothetical protein
MNRDLGLGPRDSLSEEEPSFAEKRRYPRHQLPVRCWMADGLHTVYARVHDVSLGGLSLRSPVPFAPNAEVELALVLPPSEASRPTSELSIRARGRVVWVNSPDGGASRARMGACFLDVFDEQLLQQLLGRS